MQNRIRILLSMVLALAIILSLATGALATEQEHVHNWQRTKADVMFHTMVCSDCGESKTITHTFDSAECCTVCGYQEHEHVWQYGGEFYDYSQKLTCTKCDSTSTAAHNYGSDGICHVCGYGSKEAAKPPSNSTNTNTTETKAEDANVAVTKPPETGSTESSPVETQFAETKPVASETISESTTNEDLQRSDTTWIWVAAVIVVAGGLGTAVFFWKKKS